MIQRPWVMPIEVREWSERESVKNRSDQKLAIDITRAEAYVINYTKNSFDDDKLYSTLPNDVRIAILMLAEQYAANSSELSTGVGSYKSESFDDYSYTLADTAFKIDNLDLGPLLDDFIDTRGKGDVTMKMRKL